MKQYLRWLISVTVIAVMLIMQFSVSASIPENADDFIIAGDKLLDYPYEMKDNNGAISDQIFPDADSDYLVDIDFEVNGLGNKAAYFIVYSANDAGAMRGKHLMDAAIDENGNIGFLKTPLNATAQATKDSCTEITSDGEVWLSCSTPISTNELVNIKAYLCTDDKTVSYYVNNSFVGTIKLNAYKSVLPSGVGVFKDPSFQKIGHIFSTKKFAVYPAATHHLKRYELRDYSGNKMVPDDNGKYTPDIQKIMITFAKDVDEDLLNSFELTDGNENVGMIVSAIDSKTVEVAVDGMLKKDSEYFVKCSRAEFSFATNSFDKLSVANLKFLNNEGSETENVGDIASGCKITADILNFTEGEVEVMPVINAYCDGVLQATSNFAADSVSAHAAKSIITDSIMCNYKEGMYLTAFIVSADGTPLTNEYILGDLQIADDKEWTIEYTYNANVEYNGKSAYIEIFLPEKTFKDLENCENISQVLAYRGLAEIKDGKASIKFKLYDDPDIEGDAISGVYTVRISVDGKSTVIDKLTFSNKYEFNKVVGDINAIISASDLNQNEKISAIERKITDKAYVLEVPEVYGHESMDRNKIASLIYDYVNNEAAFTEENAKNTIKQAVTIEAIAKGIYTDLFEYSEILELDNSKISAIYKKEYVTDELKKQITLAMKGDYTDKADFYNKLTEKFILVSVEKVDGCDYVKDILNVMCNEIGLDNTKLALAKDNVYTDLSGKMYENYAVLVSKFNVLYDEYNSESSKSQPSKSSGSRGNGAPSTSIVSDNSNAASENTDNTIPYDIFSDIDNHWAKNEIIKLAETGIVSGKGGNMFYPEDNITREEFVKIISEAMFVSENSSADVNFVDLDKNRWSYPYIMKCCGLGIISGYGNGLFGTEDFITRQDLAVIVYNAMLKMNYVFDDSIKKTFADENEISDYAKKAVNALYNGGLIKGVDGARFAPANLATRAEAAKIIYNLLNA